MSRAKDLLKRRILPPESRRGQAVRGLYAKIRPRLDERRVAAEKRSMIMAHETELNRIHSILKEQSPPKESIVSLPICTSVEVSIIIPAYNQADYTYRCIKSIVETTEGIDYEIILANDCSTDEVSKLDRYFLGLRMLNNDENLLFLKNCNKAAREAKGEYLVFLNNDTIVKEGWLKSLLEVFKERPSAGIVGSKLVYPDGTLQEAGGIIWQDGHGCNYGRGDNPDLQEYNYVKPVDYISGASIMIKKSLWDEIGGFDEAFAPAYYEDTDLAFEVRKRGYEVIYQPFSEVVHFEGKSNGTDTSTGIKRYQEVNHEKFVAKWKDTLRSKHYKGGDRMFAARERLQDVEANSPHSNHGVDGASSRSVIVIVDRFSPQFDKDAGSRSVWQHLNAMLDMGYSVKFLQSDSRSDSRYERALQERGVEVLYDLDSVEKWEAWFLAHNKDIDTVFLNRPQIAERYMDLIKEKTACRVVFYGHDLTYLRERRHYEVLGGDDHLLAAEYWEPIELDLARKSDTTLYPSTMEVEHMREQLTDAHVEVLPVYVYGEVGDTEYDPSQRSGMMFVGGYDHSPNEDGVCWFIEEVLPGIVERIPNIVFHVAGSNPTERILSLASENVDVCGFLSDEELSALYNQCKVVVAPLRFGAGVKGKVIEAMNEGVPVITTSIGAEGIRDDEGALVVADDPKTMVGAFVGLYEDDEELAAHSRKGRDLIRKQYSTDAVSALLRSIL